nr:hypothetical protein CFP56_66174 [Quercus suber]
MFIRAIFVLASIWCSAVLPLVNAHPGINSTLSKSHVPVLTSATSHTLVGYPSTSARSKKRSTSTPLSHTVKHSTRSKSTHSTPPGPTKYSKSSSKVSHTLSKLSSKHSTTPRQHSTTSRPHNRTSRAHGVTASVSTATKSVSGISRTTPSSTVGKTPSSTTSCSIYATITALSQVPADPVTATVTSTYTRIIVGDDGLPTCGSTYTYTELSVVYVPATATTPVVTPAYPTVTIPAPSNFVPIRKSYPQAEYAGCVGGPNPVDKTCRGLDGGFGQNLKRDQPKSAQSGTCTITSILTTTTGVPSTTTSTTTVQDPTEYIYFSEGNILTPLSECTQYTTFSYYTVTSTQYSTVVYTTEFESPMTLPLTTRTVNAACAQTNFADQTLVAGNTVGSINGISGHLDNQTTIDMYSANTAYECCLGALSSEYGAWEFSPTIPTRCRLFANRLSHADGVCGPQNADQYSVVAGQPNAVQVVVGNGFCGEVTGPQPSVPASRRADLQGGSVRRNHQSVSLRCYVA